MHILIAGGTGFIGTDLARHLADTGYAVTILSRHTHAPLDTVAVLRWDGCSLGPWQHALNDVDVVINLCGRSVDCRKTPANRDEIYASRIKPTEILGQAIAACAKPPSVWIQMSTAHIYGDPEHLVDEASLAGVGLAPDVGMAWERACLEADVPETRRIILRTSFVLGRTGGALTRLRKLTQYGLGGTIGSGRQGISWIHQDDLNRLIETAMMDPDYSGAYNATAPHPVSNREFMHTLRKAMRVRFGLPGPSVLVRLAARWPLRTDPELALLGRYCHSRRLPAHGFTFSYPKLPEALNSLVGHSATADVQAQADTQPQAEAQA